MSHPHFLPPASTGPQFGYTSSRFSFPRYPAPQSNLFQVDGGYPIPIPPSCAADMTTPLDPLPANHLHRASPQLNLSSATPSPSSSFSSSPFPDTPPTNELVDINATYYDHEPLNGFQKAEVPTFLSIPGFACYQPSPQNYSTQPQPHFLQTDYGAPTYPQNLSTQPYPTGATRDFNHPQSALLPTQPGIGSHRNRSHRIGSHRIRSYITPPGYAHNLPPTLEEFEKENRFGEAPHFMLTNFVQPEASVLTMPHPGLPFDAAEPVSLPFGLSPASDQPAFSCTTRPSVKRPRTQKSGSKAYTYKILCRWGNPMEHCGVQVLATGSAVRDHLRQYHADVGKIYRQNDGGKKDTKIECLWKGCQRRGLLNEDSLGRHICQSTSARHLLSHSEGEELGVFGSDCEFCGRSFSRRDAMLRHQKKNCDSLPR